MINRLFELAVIALTTTFGLSLLGVVYFVTLHEHVMGPHAELTAVPYLTDAAGARAPVVRAGDQLQIHWAGRTWRDCPCLHEFSIQNGGVVALGAIPGGRVARGGTTEWVTLLVVPPGLPPGPKRLIVRSTHLAAPQWPCNPILNVTATSASLAFVIGSR